LLVAGVATFSLVTAAAANAVITTTNDTNTLASALAPAGLVTGTGQAQPYVCVADDPSTSGVDESLCPTAVSDTPLAGFPTEGSTYDILTTGNAALADDPNGAPDDGYAWATSNPAMGSTVYDWNTYRFDLAPATTSCLAFDFKFLSDEFPEFINSQFNDAFIAQLGAANVTVDPSTGAISAPGNFAAGAGDMISVNASGPSATSAAASAGTIYDGSTNTLIARTPVTPGAPVSLFLTLFDQGDHIYDSAVFMDNLRYEAIDPKKCKSLALDPYEGLTGVSPIPGTAPTFTAGYAALNFPISCDLPPGSVQCTVNGSASFTATAGRSVARTGRDTRAAVLPVALAAGSVTIPASTNGVLSMTSTPAGIAAVKAAIAKPALLKHQAKLLKKKAKKLLKKAKQLREEGKIAKAKKLEKKAAKLIKRAKRLVKRANALLAKPLGTITTTITNPKNGAVATYTSILPRP
jgi:hypothetical protein